jgi:hypothetical protein
VSSAGKYLGIGGFHVEKSEFEFKKKKKKQPCFFKGKKKKLTSNSLQIYLE